MLYLETPAGVGFSFSSDSSDYEGVNDRITGTNFVAWSSIEAFCKKKVSQEFCANCFLTDASQNTISCFFWKQNQLLDSAYHLASCKMRLTLHLFSLVKPGIILFFCSAGSQSSHGTRAGIYTSLEKAMQVMKLQTFTYCLARKSWAFLKFQQLMTLVFRPLCSTTCSAHG